MHHRGEPAPNLQYFTWKNPERCHECSEVIHTHTFFYYEKFSVGSNKTPILKYYCCLDCFGRLAPTEGFKYPMNKIIQKELPENERTQLWIDPATQAKYSKIQY